MSNTPVIEISQEAYDNLIKLLEVHREYTHVKFCYLNASCCKASKIDIYLDEAKENDIITKFKDIDIIVDPKVSENIKGINLIYRDNNFLVKTELINTASKNCCSSPNSCEEKSCHNCSGCNK